MEKNTQQLETEIEDLKHEIYLLKQSIHRLAVTYIQDSKYPYWGKLLCFKIDEDKKNNHFLNLEYVSHKDNMRHNNLHKKCADRLIKANKKRKKAVIRAKRKYLEMTLMK